jgi:8-oxo-dGTP diphosphatase
MPEEYTGKVAAVVISNNDGNKYLIAKREDNGDWEFPGGKQHIDETLLKTAEREIREELGLEIEAKKSSENYSYRGGGYEIIPVLGEVVEEDFEIKLVDHSDYRWISPEKIGSLEIDLENEKKCLEAFDLL